MEKPKKGPLMRVLLAAVLGAALPLFSSQSDMPWFVNVLPKHTAPVGTALLHVTASVGVPSYSGHPLGNADCAAMIEQTMPEAKRLAQQRAEEFAKELAVTLGVPYANGRYDRPALPTLDPDATPNTFGSCGLPKFGRPPVTASVSATYVMHSAFAAIENIIASPHPQPSTPVAYVRPTFVPPVTVDSSRNAHVVSVEGTGSATLAADAVRLQLTLAPPPPSTSGAPAGIGPKNEADLVSVDDAITSIFPNAKVETRFMSTGYTGYTNRKLWQVDDNGAELTVTIPSPTDEKLQEVDRRLHEASQQLGLTLQATQSNLLNRCDDLEKAARLGAIYQAKAMLRAKAASATRARLVFADAQPLSIRSGICGPVIDASLIFGAQQMQAPDIRGTMTVRLEYVVE